MNQEILNKVTELKKQLITDGFIIEGIFGSYTRDDNTQHSDIDILYNLDKNFKVRYRGFKAISRLDDIQKNISSILNIQADLVQKSTLSEISAKYILPEVYNV